MRRAGKCDAVADNVWTIRLNWLNVRRSRFGTATAVDKFEASDRTPLVVRAQDDPTKDAVPHDAGGQGTDAFTFEKKWGLILLKAE